MNEEDIQQEAGRQVDGLQRGIDFFNQLENVENVLTYDMALNAANFARFYTTASPDLVAGVGLANVPWDMPALMELAEKDYNQQFSAKEFLLGSVKWATRNSFALADSIYDNAWSRPIRIATRMSRGEDFAEAWGKSGSSIVEQAVRAKAMGQDFDMGTGFVPAPQELHKTPGFYGEIVNEVEAQRLARPEVNLQDAYNTVTQKLEAERGVDITRKAYDAAESTLLAKTFQGETYYSPVSMGRLAAIQVVRPDTVPFTWISGSIDAPMRVGLDPLNMPADELTRAFRNRNLILPTLTNQLRNSEFWQHWDHFNIMRADLQDMQDGLLGVHQRGSQMAKRTTAAEREVIRKDPHQAFDRTRIFIDEEAARKWWQEAGDQRFAGNWSMDDPKLKPYAEGASEVFASPEDFGAHVEAYAKKHGVTHEEAFVDTVLEHEMVHRMEQHPLLDEAKARYHDYKDKYDNVMAAAGDDAIPLDVLQEMTEEAEAAEKAYRGVRDAIERDATKQAMQRLKDDTMRVPMMRRIAAKELGMGDNWRPWIKPNTVDRWRGTAAGKRVLDYLARTDSLDELLPVIGNFPKETMLKLAEAKTPDEVFSILKNLLGTPGLEAAPRLGLTNRVLGSKVLMNPKTQGLRSAMTQWEPYDRMSKTIRRYTAETTHGATIFDPVNVEQSMKNARNWMRTAGMDQKDIDIVLRKMAKSGNEFDGMQSAVDSMVSRFDKRLGELGYDERARRHIMKVFRDEVKSNNIYFVNAAGQAINEVDDAIIKIGVPGSGTRTVRVGGKVMNKEEFTAWADDLQKRTRAAEKPELVHTDDAAAKAAGFESAEEVREIWEADWKEFSRRRGYTEEEIAEYEQFMEVFGRAEQGAGWDELFDAQPPGPRGADDVLTWQVNPAVREAQFTHRNIVMPAVRDVRIATNKLRVGLDKMRLKNKDLLPAGFDITEAHKFSSTWFRWKADQIMGAWRTLALLRVGWPLRVLPDEMLRIWASGMSDTMKNPFSYIAMVIGNKGAQDLLGGSLDDWVNLKGGLGIGPANLARGTDNNPLRATRFDAEGVSWAIAHRGEDAYNVGLTRQLLQLRTSPIARKLLDFDGDIEATFQWLRKSDEGKQIVANAVDATRDTSSKFNRMAKSDQALYNVLYSYEAQIALLSGSQDWFYRALDDAGKPTGRWKNHLGQEIDDFTGINPATGVPWKSDELYAELQRLNVPGRSAAKTKADRAALLREHHNIPDFASVAPERTYMVRDTGSDRIHALLRDGADPETGYRYLPDEMGVADFEKLEAEILDLYDLDWAAPPAIQTLDPRHAAQAETWGRRAVDRWFMALGGTPTTKFMRHPMFVTRYTEELGRYWWMVDEATRVQIDQWAKTNKLARELDVYKNKYREAYGFNKPLKEGLMDIEWKDLDEAAKFRALDDVKDLLYDLTKTNNVADALRLVFPFADAWWEVLTRWAHLYNPTTQYGQVIRNVRRPGQLATEARREGWFETDQFGNEVFNFMPAKYIAGGFRMQGQVSLDQFMFVDPGNPRSIIAPGTSPMIQLPMAAVDSMSFLPVELRDALKWAAFGDFAPPKFNDVGDVVSAVMPTPYKRAMARIFKGEFKEEYANEIVQTVQGLCNSTDRRFDCSTPNGLEAATKEANKVGSQLAFARIFDGIFMPAQPRYQAQIAMLNGAFAAQENAPYWINVAAMGEEYRRAIELSGDREEAMTYMINRFGVNPLYLTPSTVAVKPRPQTEAAYKALQDAPELLEHADLTLMAFLPVDEDDDYYRRAYSEWISTGDRERITTAEQAAAIISRQSGAQAYAHLTDTYDELVEKARHHFGRYHDTFKQYIAELDNWRRDVKYEIDNQYLHWGTDGIEGLTYRPTYARYMDEVKAIATDPTKNAALAKINPQLVGFYEHVDALWKEAERESRRRDRDYNWWRTAEITRVLEPGEVNEPQALRDWFINGLKFYADTYLTDEIALSGAHYLTNRVLKPLMAGFELEDEIWIDPDLPPPPPPRPIAGDTLAEMEAMSG